MLLLFVSGYTLYENEQQQPKNESQVSEIRSEQPVQQYE